MSSAILRKDFSMNIRLGRLDGTLQIVYIWLSLWKLVDTNEDRMRICHRLIAPAEIPS